MTPVERWLAVLTRQKPDRIPMDYWATRETTEMLMKHLGCEDVRSMYECLHIDAVVAVEPDYIGPSFPEDMDIYGCRYEYVDYGSGKYRECVYNPLAQYTTVEEIEKNYTWPSPDWYNYRTLPHKIKANEVYPIQAGGSEPFLIYKNLRGQVQAFLDLVISPEMVHHCLKKLYDFCYQKTLRIYEQIPSKVTFSMVAEDMGGQENLMYSPGQIQEFLIPPMKRMIQIVHQAGAFVFHHNDGAIRKIIPDLIEAGIDILNPIQWRCRGMEREELKKEFGDKLIFHGGLDNQYTLPYGSKEEVKQEVLYNIRVLGEGGGYILAPCHNIQVNTPPENIVEIYETGYNNGWL
jgi:uroporphyrinogen decarboxylase